MNSRTINQGWAPAPPSLSRIRRQQQQAVAGTQTAVSPQSNANSVCGRLLDESVTVGGLNGIPINPGTITTVHLQGNAYVAPTYVGGSFAGTNYLNVQGLLQDVDVSIIANNVPQDGTVAAVLWSYRKTGTTTWTPWAETSVAGLPYPATSQTFTFQFGQLSVGTSYDFGLAYVSLRGEVGVTSAFKTNYAVSSSGITIPSWYLAGGTAYTPSLSSISTVVTASANNLSAAVALDFTITNQPTDGSLSRVSCFYRVTGSSSWSFYGSIPAVGVNSSSPPASASYIFVYADLTNGVGYDFGIACENHQGGETSVVYATNVTATAVVIGAPALGTAPATAPNLTSPSIAIGTLQSGVCDVTLSFTIADWVANGQPAWYAGFVIMRRIHGSSTSSVAVDVPLSGTVAYTGSAAVPVHNNAAAQDYDFGIAYRGVDGSSSNTYWPTAWSNQIMPSITGSTISTLGGPNLIADSNFDFATFNSSGIASSSAYWSYYLIDGLSFGIAEGGASNSVGVQNYLFVRPGDSSKHCKAQCETIVPTPGQLYTVSAYLDASTVSSGSPNIKIMSTDQATTYATASQTAGQHGIVSATWTCPSSGGPTQICAVFDSNNCVIASGILVMSIPMLQAGSLGPYTPGVPSSGPTPVATPPSGGTPTGPGTPAPTHTPVKAPPPGGGVTRLGTAPWQLENHFDSDTDVNGATMSSGLISGRHLSGAATTDTSALMQSSTNTMLYTRHDTSVTSTLASTTDSFGRYTKPGVIHRLHLDNGVSSNNLIFNPTFYNGTSNWTKTGSVFSWTNDLYSGGRLGINSGSAGAHPSTQEFWSTVIPTSTVFGSQAVVLSASLTVLSLGGTGDEIWIQIYDTTAGQLGSAQLAFGSVSAGTQTISCTATLPASPATILVRCVAQTGSSGACQVIGYFSKLQLEYGTRPSDFTDHISTGLTTTSHINTADAYGTYVRQGLLHRGHFDVSGQPGSHNLIHNPTFTQGTSDWSKQGGSSSVISWSTDTFGGGRLLGSGGALSPGAFEAWLSTAIPVFTSQSMVCSGIIEIDAGGVTDIRYHVDVIDSGITTVLGSVTYTPTPTGRFPFSFIVNTSTFTSLIVRCWVSNTSGSTSEGVGGVTFQKLQLEYGTQPSLWVDHQATKKATSLLDPSLNMRKSSSMNVNIPSVLPFTTDGVMHIASPSPGTTATVYIDNGTAGTGCHIYLPDGSSVGAPALSSTSVTTIASGGSYASTTTSSNGIKFTGLTNAATYYFMAAYNNTTAVWTVAISATNAPFTATQQQAIFQDGGYIAFQGSATGTSATGGGGTQSHNGCPEIHQKMQIKRRNGLIQYSEAQTLRVGDAVLDPDGTWNTVHRAQIGEAEIWEVVFDTEKIRVDASHLFDRTGQGDWINVKTLIPGDKLMRYGGGHITVLQNRKVGPGQFMHIGCDRMRYVLGKTVSHNLKPL